MGGYDNVFGVFRYGPSRLRYGDVTLLAFAPTRTHVHILTPRSYEYGHGKIYI